MSSSSQIFAGALPLHLLNAIQRDADGLSDCPNYWVPREVIEAGVEKAATPAEAAVCQLHDLVGDRLPHDWAGVEYWSQLYEGGRGLEFHFDKDEHAMAEARHMVNPLFSSVLYLTGSVDGPLQAPTVINDQRFDHEAGCPLPEDPTCSTLVFPRANSYCLFDGALGHGVLDCGQLDRRATFLVNWWRRKPQKINRVEGTQRQTPVATESGEEKEEQSPECTEPKWIEVEESELGEAGMLMIDDVLDARGCVAQGGLAVTIKHPGLSLCPIDSEQLKAAGGEVKVGAALLKCEPCESSSSSSSSGSNGVSASSENDSEAGE